MKAKNSVAVCFQPMVAVVLIGTALSCSGAGDSNGSSDAGIEHDAGVADRGDGDGGLIDAGIPDAGVDGGHENDGGLENDGGPSDAGVDGGVESDGGFTGCGELGDVCCLGPTCSVGLTCTDGLCQPTGTSEVGQACAVSADCGSSICLPLNSGSNVCSQICSATADCVDGWFCDAYPGVSPNICQCTPSAETCNGRDDDCDGDIDNEPASDQWCITQHGQGSLCEQGTCTCPTMCGDSCVDLTSDPQNCGACGVNCGGTCAGGRCLETIVASRRTSGSLEVDETNIYWGEAGSIMALPLAGGSITTLLGESYSVSGFVLAGARFYWTIGGGSCGSMPFDGSVVSTDVSGGSVTTLVSGVNPDAIAIDGSFLYWDTSYFDHTCNGGTGALLRGALTGGTQTTLATDLSSPRYLQIAAGRAFWANHETDILSVPVSGGVPTTINAGSRLQISGLATDGDSVYWSGTDYSGVQTAAYVLSAPINGGSTSTLATEGAQFLTVADGYLYWSSNGFKKMSTTGGAIVTLLSGSEASANQMIVRGNSLYWVLSGGSNDGVHYNGTIKRLTPR